MTSDKSKFYSVTVQGVHVEIPKDVVDDIEVVELLGSVQNGDIFAFPPLAKKMFGDKGFQKIKKALADEDGRTRITKVVEFFTEAMNACNDDQAKN